MPDDRAPLNDDEPFWDISGPRKYLNIPSPVPDRWRAAMTFGTFPHYETVVGWGPTEAAARADAMRQAATPMPDRTEPTQPQERP